MNTPISRRSFVKSSLLVSSALPLAVSSAKSAAGQPTEPAAAPSDPKDPMPMGRIGNHEFSRLMLGGNLVGGYAHSRDLSYVSTLMRRYNTPAKIRQTLELAESQGINVINSWVMQENDGLFEHWKNGGKMKWISQVRLDEGGGFSQLQKASDQGAVGIHFTGDTCEHLLAQGKFEKVAESLDWIKQKGLVSGVAAHDLAVIVECEKLRLEPDFYQKAFHSHEYWSSPKREEKGVLGSNDNSWCADPDAVAQVMAKTTRPWIAFKILAAGAIQPRAAFPYAFNAGADFILVGMFDWQVAENATLAKRVCRIVRGPESKRARPWHGDKPAV
jgi:hypothetical protein